MLNAISTLGSSLSSGDTPHEPMQHLVAKSLQRILRPLVRLLLGVGITFPILSDVLRRLFIDVANKELLLTPRDRTDSRISLLTGIHRKEIKRLRDQPIELPAENRTVTLSSAIVARWLGDKAYLNPEGSPRALPRHAEEGQSSFETLVQSVTSDLRPRTVLDDWVAQKLVTVSDNGLISLNTMAFIPRPGREEQLYYFTRNLHDHLAAATANIQANDQAPCLDRSVHYDRLPPAIAATLDLAAREKAQKLLVDINRLALELLEKHDSSVDPSEPPEETQRFNLGVYTYIETERG